MAAYKTHISISTLLGVGYATVGFLQFHFQPIQCVLAGMLTSVAGMLPDLDSESGRPVREVFGLFAAITPFVLMPRLMEVCETTEELIVASMAVYFTIRHGGAWLLGYISVHRGMFHSLPAMVIATQLGFLSYQNEYIEARYFIGGGIGLGFLSHLVLDELYSVTWTGLKKSAGSAMKLYGDSFWPNVITFAILMTTTTLMLWDIGYVKIRM